MNWLKKLFSWITVSEPPRYSYEVPQGIDRNNISEPVWGFLNTFHHNPKRFQLTKVLDCDKLGNEWMSFYTLKDRLTGEAYTATKEFHRHIGRYSNDRLEFHTPNWLTSDEQRLLRFVLATFYERKLTAHRKIIRRKVRLAAEAKVLKEKQERERLSSIYNSEGLK